MYKHKLAYNRQIQCNINVAVNLRNSPVDKRRLKKADRETYKPKQAKQALAKVKAWRGQQAWEANRPVSSESKRGGTGGFTQDVKKDTFSGFQL